MKVVLLKDVKGIGKRFEEKNVSDGHANNFLIPKKLAVPANEAGQIKMLKENEAKERETQNKRIETAIAEIAGTEIRLSLKANEQGHLFAALNPQKLSQILQKEKGVAIDPDYILLNSPIKSIGTFEIPVQLGGKASPVAGLRPRETKFTLLIEAE
jgi:large subunit ribosomal protein L9